MKQNDSKSEHSISRREFSGQEILKGHLWLWKWAFLSMAWKLNGTSKRKLNCLGKKNEKVLETAIKNSREINKGGLREIKGLQEYSKWLMLAQKKTAVAVSLT